MATERQAPDAVLDSTNYSSLALGDIDEDPDSPDASWGAWDGNGNTICRVSFPSPTGDPTTGAGQQEFRVWARKSSSGGNATLYSLELWENGVQVSVLSTGTVSSTSGELLSGTWDAALLGTADGSLVELAFVQTDGGGGSPSSRRGLEVGAAEWSVTYSSGSVIAADGSAQGAGVASASAAAISGSVGSVAAAAAVAVVGGAIVLAVASAAGAASPAAAGAAAFLSSGSSVASSSASGLSAIVAGALGAAVSQAVTTGSAVVLGAGGGSAASLSVVSAVGAWLALVDAQASAAATVSGSAMDAGSPASATIAGRARARSAGRYFR